ncbi:MAG: sodium:solute symporter [candidate division KSB1 bacterium]|nr:sodium:solute symporter [candidate division KSB1 bacterium]
MNLSLLDWFIVAGMVALTGAVVLTSRTHMRSVADFLAAGRTAGRYVISVSQGMAALGAITVVATFEMNYYAGLPMTWWGFMMTPVVVLITVTGWVVYRFRQTRALTMAQFFEMRYSRRFRIFAGTLAFVSGIINFGIFPAVGARFFIYFCGLPQSIHLAGLEISTLPLTMAVLLSLSLTFVFAGGQIAVIITDFVQGLFANVVFLVLVLYFMRVFDWAHIAQALQSAPADASLINPFHTTKVEHFNLWYFLIGVYGAVYSTLSWQGTQGYNASAKNAHEAKMAGVLSNWRGFPQNMMLLFLPICAYTVLHHGLFAEHAAQTEQVLSGIANKAVRSQLTVPMALLYFMPHGLLGAFVAVMLAALVSTDEAYLHSWGSIFVQDVLVPMRGRRLEPREHIKWLRMAILGVAVFSFFFSLLFKQSEYILLFFAITGAIYAGGSGAVIIGGLYWKRGTTAAAWAALITGSTVAVAGIVLQQLIADFPINGQVCWFIAMVSSTVVYILVSLLHRGEPFDMDRLLHRGRYRIAGEYTEVSAAPQRGWRVLGMGPEFTRGDRALYIATYAWSGLWVAVFVAGTIYNLTHQVPDSAWLAFWRGYLLLGTAIAMVVTVWLAVGGFRDAREMLHRLATMKRDLRDDGTVEQQVAQTEATVRTSEHLTARPE